jgi:phage terminase large subunit
VKVQIAEKLSFLFEPYRYKVAHGGRGGTKSRAFASALVILSRKTPERILCCREIQNSIKDSVKKIIEDEIERLGWGDAFHITRDGITCKENGSEFIFAGLKNNVDSIKSMEGITRCWCEEAHTLSQYSLDILIPTIRKEGSELWFSYNPKYDTDPVHSTFVVNDPPPGSCVVEINWRDNPWFPPVLKAKLEWDKTKDHDKYLHVWEGKCVQFSDEQVMRGVWTIGETPDPPLGTEFRYSLDFGFGADPTAGNRFWISGRKLYIDYESHGVGVDIDDTPKLLTDTLPDVKRWVVKADSARPDSISYLNKNDLRVVGAKKGPNSIEDGISRLRGYEIVINPRCKFTIEEFTKYSYKKDKQTDVILPDIIDDWNHHIDGLRYGTEGLEAEPPYINGEYVSAAMIRVIGADINMYDPKILSVFCGSPNIITKRQGACAVSQFEVSGILETEMKITEEIGYWNPQAIIIDTSTEFGAALTLRLRTQGKKVIDINPTVKTGKYSEFSDIHSGMWSAMSAWLPLADIPNDDGLKIDLLAPIATSTKGGSGKYVVEGFEDTCRRVGRGFLLGKAQSLALTFAVNIAPQQPERFLSQAERDWLVITGLSNDSSTNLE